MKIHIGNYPKNGSDQKIKIQIDRWDTWSMDHTLSRIIHPMLIQLKKTKHGIPGSMLDAPYNKLSSSSAYWKEKKNGPIHKKVNKLFKEAEQRWDDILDQMIWSFKQMTIDWEKQYHSGRIDRKFVPLKDKPGFSEWVKGPKDTSKFDKKGYSAHAARIQKGFDLFGKHFWNLWD